MALLVGLPIGPSACQKERLTEIAVPESGVNLRYDLAPGQAYGGHVRMRNALQTQLGEVLTKVEFDVDMVVSGPADAKSRVHAKISDLKVELRLPDGLPPEMAGSIPPEAVAAVEGMELDFLLDASGSVSDMPPPPRDAAQEAQAVAGMVTGALQAAFVRVPEQALKQGDTWDAVSKDDEPGRTGTGSFSGMARDEGSGQDVARLSFAFESQGSEGKPGAPARGPGKQTVDVLFSAQGFPVKVSRKASAVIKGVGDLNSETSAEWKKLQKRSVPPPAQTPAPTEDAEITDPCDPDYVGPEQCAEGA